MPEFKSFPAPPKKKKKKRKKRRSIILDFDDVRRDALHNLNCYSIYYSLYR